MLSIAKTPEQMKELRADMDRRLISFGRDPNSFHIFYIAFLFLGWNQRDAQERKAAFEAAKSTQEGIDYTLWVLSYLSGGVVDYSKYGLDDPFPQELGNGQVSTFEHILANNPGATMREVLEAQDQLQGLTFTGDADSIAEQMNEVIQVTGRPDGFLVHGASDQVTRKDIAELTDGLCATLRKKGYIRDTYAYDNFRENLNDNQ
jgi:alkanesulfonate monooxygenase SsuD/methylene tetrahydromethanopterin reductase-like flavin-dependent oxidoreductase (luciferase family)